MGALFLALSAERGYSSRLATLSSHPAPLPLALLLPGGRVPGPTLFAELLFAGCLFAEGHSLSAERARLFAECLFAGCLFAGS